MCKTKIFAEILKTVSNTTEIDIKDIYSNSRDREIIDARCILINILFNHYNFSANYIAKIIHCTTMNVYYHINEFDNRLNQSRLLQFQYQITIKELKENNLLTF